MNRLRNPRSRFAAVLVAAAALAAILIGASQVGARRRRATAPADGGSGARPPRRRPSRRSSPGSSSTAPRSARRTRPVTLVEYADLQCPYCAQWARDALPTLVEDYVKPGKLRIVFRGMAFIGPDSDKALRTAIAAGEQNHLWDVVHGLYLSQGAENAGWVTDELVAESRRGGARPRRRRLLDDAAGRARSSRSSTRAAAAARAAGVEQHADLPGRPDRRPARARPGRARSAPRGSSRRSRRCWRR